MNFPNFDRDFELVLPIATDIDALHGASFLVGGAVRDMLSGRDCKDFDIEVFGLSREELIELLMAHGTVKLTGQRFQVIKCVLDGQEFDFSLPRRDLGVGRNEFETECDPNMTTQEASERRDFTINSMMLNLLSGEVIDHFGGTQDLDDRILRPTSDKFADDPLRIMRGVQFASRFGMMAAMDNDSKRRFSECVTGQGLERLTLLLGTDPMRVEATKWLLSDYPGSGLFFMQDTGLLPIFPELQALATTMQDKRHHPEGNVLVHTALVMGMAAVVCHDLDNDIRLRVVTAAMCHDLGKPECTIIHEDGSITSAGHAELGVVPTQTLLEKLGFIVPEANSQPFADNVKSLVANHMIHLSIDDNTNLQRFVRRLATRVNIAELALVVSADMSGRPATLEQYGTVVTHPLMSRIVEIASELEVSNNKPVALVMGRHLISLGLKHGKDGVNFTEVLDACFEAQLDGLFETVELGLEFACGFVVAKYPQTNILTD